LASGNDLNTGLSNAVQYAAQGAERDDAYAIAQKAEAERIDGINKTVEMLRQRGLTDLADMAAIPGADMGSIYNEALTRMRPKDPTKMEFRDVNGDIIGIDPYAGTSQVVYDGPAAMPSMPTSYQEFQLAQQNPDYAASLSSSTSKPPTEGERRNQQLSSVIEPELQVVEDNWDALTNPADQANANFGRAATSPEYQAAADSLKTIAQSYLYSISGQAATDSETEKIVSSLTPVFGESKASADNKKARVRRMVEAVKTAGGRAAPAGGADDPMGIR
jgi:hypothetical protein